MIRLGLAGDVMLGRLVDRYVLADPDRDPGFVWGSTLPLWQRMDLRMVNLECVIASTGEPWMSKMFRFRARPRALEALAAAGIDLVNLANNHILDFGYDALRECLTLLRSPIRFVGAGETLDDAAAPALVSAGGLTVAVLGICDGEPAWEARSDRPGINYIRFDNNGLEEPYLRRLQEALARARDAAQLVLISAHVGPNWGPPTRQMRALAHQLVDLGADLYWGHSNHTVQGIEIYEDRPILYSCGDFIDDYAVDPEERNDLSCLFEVQIEAAQVIRVLMHPVRIAGFHVNVATGEDVRWLHRWLTLRMEEFDTQVTESGDLVAVDIHPGQPSGLELISPTEVVKRVS